MKITKWKWFVKSDLASSKKYGILPSLHGYYFDTKKEAISNKEIYSKDWVLKKIAIEIK